MSPRVLGACALGIASGVLGYFFIESTYVLFLFFLFALSFLCFFAVTKQKLCVYVSMFFIALALTGLRTESIIHDVSDFQLNTYVGTSVTILGKVDTLPNEREQGIDIILSPNQVNDMPLDEHARILVRIPYVDVSYGDTVSLSGILEVPEDFETDTGRMFNYDAYLAKDDIYFTVRSYTFEKVGPTDVDFKSYVFRVKTYVLRLIYRMYPEPESSLLAGLTLGVRQSLDPNFRDALIATGTIHIVALSGYNIAIIAQAVIGIFSVFRKRVQIVLSIILIILFVIMTGAGSTIVRAAIMGSCALLARMFGRQSQAGRMLVITFCVMTLFDPRLFLYDVSFHLSFLATLGIIYMTPLMESWFTGITEKFGLRNTVASTLGAQSAVLPYLIWSTGQLSLTAPFINILIVPFVTLSMLFGFLSIGAGLISFPFGTLFGFIAAIPLVIIKELVYLFAKVPFGSVVIGEFSWIIVVCIYSGGVWFVYKKQQQKIAQ